MRIGLGAGGLLAITLVLAACTTTTSEAPPVTDDGDATADVDTTGPKDLAADEAVADPGPEGPIPCTDNLQCPLGICPGTGANRTCGTGCTDGACAGGTACVPVVNPQNDLLPLCLAVTDTLCRPCAKDADCRPDGVTTRDLCVDAGPDVGSFCGRDCQAADCPEGYQCQDVARTEGTFRQCRPSGGACACTPEFTAAGFQTPCYVTNLHGTCAGKRACGPEGLTACDAGQPDREICGNGVDDNCNGLTDEENCQGCTEYYYDGDGDGFGVQGNSRCLGKPEGKYTATQFGDCDDNDKQINPTRPEACNGKDDNCNGLTDEPDAWGCMKYYLDADQDGYGALDTSKCLCAKTGKYTASSGDDCNDSNPAVHPNAKEVCDGIDNDCDGTIDNAGAEGCSIRYYDHDKDGYGVEPAQTKCVCGAQGFYTALVGGDCNDEDAAVYPGRPELCGNGKDDDCNGLTDETGCVACVNLYLDLDGDGYGQSDKYKCLATGWNGYTAALPGDCNDGDLKVRPGAIEKCNGKDDNCDGVTDEEGATGCLPFFLDADHDGYGVVGTSKCLCTATGDYAAPVAGDCDDLDADANPGRKEICDGKDNNCDGVVDEEGAEGCVPYYYDADGDGYGLETLTKCLCGPNGPYRALKPGDCNDADPAIHPDAVETCNGKDDNCDGAVDPEGAAGCVPYWVDGDGDGYGTGTGTKCLCAPSGKYTATKGGDCDDANLTIHPDAPEVCNGKDDNCNGLTDEGGACRPVIGIDAVGGPGAGTCGCACDGDFDFAVADALRALLLADTANAAGGGEWGVVMTRAAAGDNPDLAARLAALKAGDATRVVSIGGAAMGTACGGGDSGTTTWMASYGGLLAQDLAAKAQAAVVAALGLPDLGVQRGTMPELLVKTTVPTAFVAWGFVTNATDSAKMTDAANVDKVARALLHALQQHYGKAPFDP